MNLTLRNYGRRKKKVKRAGKTGRPKLVIDWKVFETACKLFATKNEICGLLEVSDSTLSRKVKVEYGVTFDEYIKQGHSFAKVSLRRNQFKLSEKSAAMAIFLGKNYLDQKDVHGLGVSGDMFAKEPPGFEEWDDKKLTEYIKKHGR